MSSPHGILFAFSSWLFYDLWISSFGECRNCDGNAYAIHYLPYWWKFKFWQVFHIKSKALAGWWYWRLYFHKLKTIEINSESGFYFSYDKIDEMFWFWYEWKDWTRMDVISEVLIGLVPCQNSMLIGRMGEVVHFQFCWDFVNTSIKFLLFITYISFCSLRSVCFENWCFVWAQLKVFMESLHICSVINLENVMLFIHDLCISELSLA